MTRFRTIIVVTATMILGLSCVPPARAGWMLERSQIIARVVWHDPCGGDVQLRWAKPDETWAFSEISRESDCTVTLSSIMWWTWPTLCTAMIHEYGHAAGFLDPSNTSDPSHSSNPRSVMYWQPDTDPRCAQKGRPFLARVIRAGQNGKSAPGP